MPDVLAFRQARYPADAHATGSLEINTLAPPDRPAADTHSAVARLQAALASAIQSPLRPSEFGRALVALAHVDPAACLRYLCDEAGTPPLDGVASGEFSMAVTAALSDKRADGALRNQAARVLATRRASMLDVSAAVAVARALGAEMGHDDRALLGALVERFPTDATLLRLLIDARAKAADTVQLDGLLDRLARLDRTPATVGYIRKMRPQSGFAPVRVALVSSFTIDPLVPYVDLSCRALRLAPEIYVAPFNSWTTDLIDPTSGLRDFSPEIAFLSVSIDDLIPQLAGSPDPADLTVAGETAVQRVLVAARAFTSWAGGRPLVVHAFHSAFASPLGVADGREHTSRSAWLAGLNERLASGLRELPATYVLDVVEAVALAGATLSDNPKVRHLAAMRLPPQSLAGIADAYARYIAPLKGLTRKCVVVDLDNTLWGGVVGEDGKDGIRLGDSSPGSEFIEFQAFLRSLTTRGILLAIASKNNAADALDVIRTHEAMVLREADFSAMRINWAPKPENVREIARELNIGIDSLIFLDDNPDERERMRQMLPEVLTVELPRDPALYRTTVERLPELATLAVTDDDRNRVQAYQAANARSAAKHDAASIDEYLASLEISITIESARPQHIARVTQLFSKTNQFNVTTRRYDAADTGRFIDDPAHRLWILSSRDRFGDHGLVALALVRIEDAVWTIDSLLMSCRVIGYGIETALLAHIVAHARAARATDVYGEFIATAKNEPAKELFSKNGFTPEPAGQARHWRFDPQRALDVPGWIGVARDDA